MGGLEASPDELKLDIFGLQIRWLDPPLGPAWEKRVIRSFAPAFGIHAISAGRTRTGARLPPRIRKHAPLANTHQRTPYAPYQSRCRARWFAGDGDAPRTPSAIGLAAQSMSEVTCDGRCVERPLG